MARGDIVLIWSSCLPGRGLIEGLVEGPLQRAADATVATGGVTRLWTVTEGGHRGTAELDSAGGYALMVIYKARLFDHRAWCIGSLPAIVGNLSKPGLELVQGQERSTVNGQRSTVFAPQPRSKR